MEDIKKFENDNLGGVIRFRFIPVTHVESIDLPVKHVIMKPVTLVSGKRWFDAYATFGTMGFAEPSEQTANGEVFKPQLIAICPKDSEADAYNFNDMRNQRFIVEYTDNNGLRKLIGSTEEPLFFKTSLNTKTEPAGRNEHSIVFYGQVSHKAYVYDF